MFAKIHGLAALALLVGVVGCAEIPSVPYDRTTAHVTNIEVMGPSLEAQPAVIQAATVGQSFGLVGALIDAGIEAEREKRLAAILTAQAYQPPQAFPKALTPVLQAKGYTVTYGDAKRESSSAYVTDFPVVSQGTDAYLDVVVNGYGYLLTGMAAQFRPYLWVKCKLVRASDHAVLMESEVDYNPLRPTKGVVAISPTDAFQFNRLDDMEADPKKTIAGLDDAFSQVSATIGTLLQ